MNRINAFGFSTEPKSSGEEFLPFVKYDARYGQFKRIDRVNQNGQWINNEIPLDINAFIAIFDLENIETGWLDFTAQGSPSTALVRVEDLDRGASMPPQPTERHKNGIRVMIKLPDNLANGKPIRELASTAKVFVNGMLEIYNQYTNDRRNPINSGKLPAIALDGQPIQVKTGSGAKSSTNFQPKFRITGWAERGNLIWSARPGAYVQPRQQPQQQQPQQH